MDPSVSVASAAEPSAAAVAAPEPELEPHGLRSRMYGMLHWPPTPLQPLELANIEQLTDYTWRVRRAVNAQGFPEVDHVELFAPSPKPGVNSRNFVLCPGKAYDRSPCGTGTSAKLACLAESGKLAAGTEWVQESIVGSVFRGSYRRDGEKIIPTITGAAHVSGEGVLLLDAADPFRWGIR